MRLIDADAFFEAQKTRCGGTPLIGTCARDNAFLFNELDKAPTIDHVPERYGRWEKTRDAYLLRCSACHDCYIDKDWTDGRKWNFCPECGADMRGESDGRGKT